ncbi:hypothetical protein ALC62_12920, partial [Cyphomyrmex costatus]
IAMILAFQLTTRVSLTSETRQDSVSVEEVTFADFRVCVDDPDLVVLQADQASCETSMVREVTIKVGSSSINDAAHKGHVNIVTGTFSEDKRWPEASFGNRTSAIHERAVARSHRFYTPELQHVVENLEKLHSAAFSTLQSASYGNMALLDMAVVGERQCCTLLLHY